MGRERKRQGLALPGDPAAKARPDQRLGEQNLAFTLRCFASIGGDQREVEPAIVQPLQQRLARLQPHLDVDRSMHHSEAREDVGQEPRAEIIGRA